MTRAPTKIWQFLRQFSLRSSFWEALLYTETGRNMTERGGMKRNDTGMKITGMRLEWIGIWWPEPKKRAKCDALAFHFVLFFIWRQGTHLKYFPGTLTVDCIKTMQSQLKPGFHIIAPVATVVVVVEKRVLSKNIFWAMLAIRCFHMIAAVARFLRSWLDY